ncbi:MAG: hypothetical protein ACK41Y_16445 [Paracoccus hibiscisoli]|uniref:hypothetical protein n=1 Tax=Paracoccus hibiscisoli TaxID=2023261 RepID=UPI00391D740D
MLLLLLLLLLQLMMMRMMMLMQGPEDLQVRIFLGWGRCVLRASHRLRPWPP